MSSGCRDTFHATEKLRGRWLECPVRGGLLVTSQRGSWIDGWNVQYMLLQSLDHSCPLREQLALLVDPAGQHFVTVVVVKSSTKMYDNERVCSRMLSKKGSVAHKGRVQVRLLPPLILRARHWWRPCVLGLYSKYNCKIEREQLSIMLGILNTQKWTSKTHSDLIAMIGF